MIKKSNGFSTLSFIILLPLIMLLTTTYFLIQFSTQHSDQFNSKCLIDARPIQKKISIATDQIISLNPYSTLLRQQILSVSVALAAAVSSQNYALAAELSLKLKQLKNKQKYLDQLQRSLMTKTNFDLFYLQRKMQVKFNLNQQQKTTPLKFLTDSIETTKIIKFATLGLVPDSYSEIAPNYTLSSTHIQQHMMVLSWQFKTTKSTYTKKCSLSSKKEGKYWQLVIKRDKF